MPGRLALGTILTVVGKIKPTTYQSQGGHCHSTTELLLDFLLKPQKLSEGGKIHSGVNSLNTGTPQGCVLSPLLFTLMTHDCYLRFNTNHIWKYVDSTTVVGLTGWKQNIYGKGVGWTVWSWKSTRQGRCRKKKITTVFFCNENIKTGRLNLSEAYLCVCSTLTLFYFIFLLIQFEKKLDQLPHLTSFKMLLRSPKPAQVTTTSFFILL